MVSGRFAENQKQWAGPSQKDHTQLSVNGPCFYRMGAAWEPGGTQIRSYKDPPFLPITLLVIITRTPLRISIGGGGTDLPSYYRRFGGFVIAAAINKYIYVSINEAFRGGYFLKYSAFEHTQTIDEIHHPLMREALRIHQVAAPIEITTIADIPAGTGLGSSGSFTVGLLRALHAHKRSYVNAAAVAKEACHIEIDLLDQPVGKQDQYIAAHGGLVCFDFHENDEVTITPLRVSNSAMYELEEHLLMFFTGYSRNASSVLDDQKIRSEIGDSSMLDNLHFIKQLGGCIKTALEQGNVQRFGELMHEHWMHKKQRSPGTSNEGINRWYDVGRENGAIGGKLVGAGGGGFLLFLAEDRKALRKAMDREGLREVRFSFDQEGSTLLARD